MSIDDMKKSEKVYLLPSEIAPILGCACYSINVQARQDPSKLGFPIIVMGSRVRIPRIPFLHFLGYGSENDDNTFDD